MAERSYDFLMPSVNFFGPGVISKIGDRAKMLGMKKPVIVTDKFLEGLKDGAVEQTLDSLKAAGVDYVVYNNVEPNLRFVTSKKLRNFTKNPVRTPSSLLVGVLLTILVKVPALFWLMATTLQVGWDWNTRQALPPLIAVNTTAGTGSELTRHAVITNEETHLKFVVVSWRNIPLVSFNDPTLMLDVPKGLTAATGMDAFVQAVEPYVSVDHNLSPTHNVWKLSSWLKLPFVKPLLTATTDARTKMVEAEMLAGMAFNNAKGYVHAMAHQLGGQYDAPHGVCCALLLPYVEEYNIIACPDRFAQLAEIMGENTEGLSTRDAAELAIKAMKQLSEDVGIPHSIKEIGAKPEDFELMAENALKDGNAFSNPRKGTKEDIIKIFQAAYDAE